MNLAGLRDSEFICHDVPPSGRPWRTIHLSAIFESTLPQFEILAGIQIDFLHLYH